MESPTTKGGASFENSNTMYAIGPWTIRKTSWILDVPGESILCAYLCFLLSSKASPVSNTILLDFFLFTVSAEVSALGRRRRYLTIVLFSSKGSTRSKA